MTPPESASVALELERLRGAVLAGFAELNGRLDTTLQRTSQTEKDIGELETRVGDLERRVWTFAGGATVLGAGAGVLVQFLGGGA